jgi:hypothetical protein
MPGHILLLQAALINCVIQGGAEPTNTFQVVIDNIWKQGKLVPGLNFGILIFVCLKER